jgi:hypothetical protein
MALGSTQTLTEMKPGIFLGVKCNHRVRLTTSPPSVSRLSRNCGSFYVWQPYGLPRLVKWKEFSLVTNINKLNMAPRHSTSKGPAIVYVKSSTWWCIIQLQESRLSPRLKIWNNNMAMARRCLDLMGCHVKRVPAKRDSEFCRQGLV